MLAAKSKHPFFVVYCHISCVFEKTVVIAVKRIYNIVNNLGGNSPSFVELFRRCRKSVKVCWEASGYDDTHHVGRNFRYLLHNGNYAR